MFEYLLDGQEIAKRIKHLNLMKELSFGYSTLRDTFAIRCDIKHSNKPVMPHSQAARYM